MSSRRWNRSDFDCNRYKKIHKKMQDLVVKRKKYSKLIEKHFEALKR